MHPLASSCVYCALSDCRVYRTLSDIGFSVAGGLVIFGVTMLVMLARDALWHREGDDDELL